MRKFKEGNTAQSIDEKKIEKHKDFDQVLTNYNKIINDVHKKPLYRSRKGFLLILLIVLIISAIVISTHEHDVKPIPVEKNKQR